MSHWTALDRIASRGSQAQKAGSLAGLHAKRQEVLSQYFTPEWVVGFAWQAIAPAFAAGQRYRLLDNSVGAGSWFRFADPARHSLHGLDIDGEVVARVTDVLDASGFTVDIQAVGMETAKLGRYSAALINPPFSITLSSPHLTPRKGITHYGRHGPDSSALSHEYALAQALDHADIVCAVLPRTTTQRLEAGAFGDSLHRLRAVYALPVTTFQAENVASVSTDLLIFGGSAHQGEVIHAPITEASRAHPLEGLCCASEADLGDQLQPIGEVGVNDAEAVVTLPATGDRRVTLTRAGRQIALRFRDGATQVRVYNALYQSRLHSTHLHRYPATTRYAGQMKLSLDVLALQPDPEAALEQVAQIVQEAGGQPVITDQLRYGLRALVREHHKMSVPYGRVVYRKGTPSFTATARKMAMLNRRQRGAVVAMGEVVKGERTSAGFAISTSRGTFDCDHDHFFTVFDMQGEAANADYWEAVHPPIRETFPQAIAQLERKALALGLDKWLSWDFQLEDLCELAFRPRGGVCGWQMALGKTRLALALAILQQGHSLIVVKSRLVDEFCRELQTLGVDERQYQLISGASDTHDLRKINIISYDRLKRPLDTRFPRLTLARRLKGRIATVICDEGGVLSNPDSQQSRALWQLGGKRCYAFDGTPMANYPREMLPLASWAIGEARSYQPYSISGGHIQASLMQSASQQRTGRQAFMDDFVCIDWATNEFLDTGKGAKREIPRIRAGGMAAFRRWIGPLIKRRVQQEPAVTKHVRFPVPTLHPPITVDWDFDHLVLYVQAVEEFADWYRRYAEDRAENQKALNLTVILARLEACFKATNAPHTVSGFAKPYLPLTSKQRRCLDLIEDEIALGRRPIVFARNPSTLRRLAAALDERGITHMVFTGEQTITERTRRLNADIREGNKQVMLASIGVTQDGLNLPELNTFIFYNRSFKSREEFQAIYRLIRSTQTRDVYGYFLHMAGSIDEYMGQMIEWKALASEAGLDYGESDKADSDFVHFDTFFHRFIASLPELRARIDAYAGQRLSA
ncbi:DEAD/DEAH box helicase [Vreelandella rituensis]|uniref:ATP-dependent helicase n=1 Tax=Vreelandella rituensis TaxID=2282306 RepID=A0A368U8Y4_9GAMM|nr:DEAD/DEAH box helicase [Halomonas rituensis]RCV93658.1 ATP-dependent helicase [Halomonas rituensis]